MTAFSIEHPEGLFMVDTGETSKIADPEYTKCDAVTGMFYQRNLQFAVPENEQIGVQMRLTGLEPKRVSKVVMTHLHSDHMGGMAAFERAQFLVSETARLGHAGALMCRIPQSLNIQSAPYDESKLVYSTGHQSVLSKMRDTRYVLLATQLFHWCR